MDIKALGESGLIRRIADTFQSSHPSILRGIGDDAAVLKLTGSSALLATCDLLLEDVHFDLSLTDPLHLGKKAIAVNLSDIAAMGGIPRFFLVSLGLPPHLPVEFIDDLYRGMTAVSAQHQTLLVGGDSNASPHKLIIDITVLGEVPEDQPVRRDGAQNGDSIWVTGTLGDAALGFALLRKEQSGGSGGAPAFLRERHLSPSPRVNEGRVLAEQHLVSAMIDISDGLLADLSRILSASGTGARVWLTSLPLSEDFIRHQAQDAGSTIDYALSGGEDYELLFTVPKKKEATLLSVAHRFSVPITRIGEITSPPDLEIIDHEGKPYATASQGYDHFSSLKGPYPSTP